HSDWPCTLEKGGDKICVRLGMRYVKGLRQEAAQAIVRERARGHFTSIDDLERRVPELRKPELVMLAEIGALNWVGERPSLRSGQALDGARAGATANRRALPYPVQCADFGEHHQLRLSQF